MKICSAHAQPEDIKNPYTKKRRLKSGFFASVFNSTEDSHEISENAVVRKLKGNRAEQEEASDTASGGKGDELNIRFSFHLAQNSDLIG